MRPQLPLLLPLPLPLPFSDAASILLRAPAVLRLQQQSQHLPVVALQAWCGATLSMQLASSMAFITEVFTTQQLRPAAILVAEPPSMPGNGLLLSLVCQPRLGRAGMQALKAGAGAEGRCRR
jgi:hypothetical protein